MRLNLGIRIVEKAEAGQGGRRWNRGPFQPLLKKSGVYKGEGVYTRDARTGAAVGGRQIMIRDSRSEQQLYL